MGSQASIRDDQKSALAFSWTFAIIWNAISWPVARYAFRAASGGGTSLAWIALLFPAVGILLLAQAVVATLRWRKFGTSYFDLEARVTAGGSLAGRIRTRLEAPPAGPIRATLSCLNVVTSGSGKDRSVWEKIVWQETLEVPAASIAFDPGGTGIPIAIALPADARATDETDRDDRILWRLEISADLPGLDLRDRFEVPVWPATAGAAAPTAAREASARRALEPPANPSIAVEPGPEGGMQFSFPALRNVGAAIGFSCFFLLFAGVSIMFVFLAGGSGRSAGRPGAGVLAVALFGGPVLVVFLAFDLLLLLIVLHIWFASSRALFAAGEVRVTYGLCGAHWQRAVPFADVRDLRAVIAAQAGSTPYYDLRLVLRDGRTHTIGSMVRDKREAEWLVEQMKRALSLVTP